MNIGKRFDRMKQWTDERMGKEIKTAASDEFKALELEMQLRHEGMERLQKSMTTYVKSLSKTKETEDKEKTLPIAYLGATMASHGDDFEPDSEFGQCLSTLGRANERIARMQETYVSNATNSWLESVERSLAQMKEYQTARKRLETRRLAYDTSMNKLQKAKKDDFALEESARAQKAKYDEASDDVQRRMLDIKEAEVDSIIDLGTFLDAELAYYDRAREILMQAKKDWPTGPSGAGSSLAVPGGRRSVPRSRSNTGASASFRQIDEDGPVTDFRPPIRARAPSGTNSPRRELSGFDLPTRPSSRFEGPSSINSRDASPVALPRLSRVPTDSSLSLRQGLRPSKRNDSANSDVFGDQDDYAVENDRYNDERPASPASYNAPPGVARSASWSAQSMLDAGGAKKQAPPPPPSRAKKPPPPPPMKRSALSTSDVPRHYQS